MQHLFKLNNFFLFLKLAWKMFHANNTFGYYHRFVRRVAKYTINQSYLLNDGSIPDRIFKKIQWYMVEALFMGEMLANLVGHQLSKRDKESLIYLGSIMALFDVIIDDFRFDRSAVNKILDNTFSENRRTLSHDTKSIEKIFYLYLDKLTSTIEKEYWVDISEHLDIIKLQIMSEEQYGVKISEDRVTYITKGKGGVSALICSAFLKQKSESFNTAVFELGGFIQMMNDCQDIHKDSGAGIKTFVNFQSSFRDIYSKLNRQRVNTFIKIKSLDYSYNSRSETLFILNAIFTVIAYKLHRYAVLSDYQLDFNVIAKMDSNKFRIDPFSFRAITACFSKIMRFDFENFESFHDFNFEHS